MSALRKVDFSERFPDALEMSNASQLQSIIASQLDEEGGAKISVANKSGNSETITLAPALAESFLAVLRLVSSGKGFRMIPVDAELTTQEAADLLNVSRTYFIKLLESGEIAFTKTGRHRKIKASDLFEYKHRRDEVRSAALSELAELDAEMDLL